LRDMNTYFIIGADGREYGPASLDELRQWVREHRADAHSKVRQEGETSWRTLGECVECEDLFRSGPGVQSEKPAAAPPALPGAGEQLAASILARGYQLEIGECFSRGWALLVGRFWLLVGAAALMALLVFGLWSIPGIGVWATIALSFVLLGGLYWLYLRELRGHPVDIGAVFVGFGPLFVPLLIAGSVASSLVVVGGLLCVVPGVYLVVAWHMFAPLLMIDKGLGFWQALECSRKVVTRHWWACAGLFLLGVLAVSAGLLACLVGAVITLPLFIAAVVVAYEDIFGEGGPKRPQVVGAGGAPNAPGPEAAEVPSAGSAGTTTAPAAGGAAGLATEPSDDRTATYFGEERVEGDTDATGAEGEEEAAKPGGAGREESSGEGREKPGEDSAKPRRKAGAVKRVRVRAPRRTPRSGPAAE